MKFGSSLRAGAFVVVVVVDVIGFRVQASSLSSK